MPWGEVFSAIIKVQESSNISNFIGVSRFKWGNPKTGWYALSMALGVGC